MTGNFKHIANRHQRRNGNRILQDAGFETLDLGHFSCLSLGREVLVDDADTALLSQSNGKTPFRHGIHGGREQRKVQGNVAGQLGSKTDIAREDLRMCGDEQHVVEGEGFLQQSHGL
ncbi:hypothetical protein SDC9_171059 [bioreactor metagenome]|uniref:Uncharacterized protein n=1 Tax=bioreactor metagenome TaxID=1076179 RepID=A0A645GC18_9ZZZZ